MAILEGRHAHSEPQESTRVLLTRLVNEVLLLLDRELALARSSSWWA